MKERIDAVFLTNRGTLIEGWLEKENATTLCAKYDKNVYPHLEDINESDIFDILTIHEYGDRYSTDTSSYPILSNLGFDN